MLTMITIDVALVAPNDFTLLEADAMRRNLSEAVEELARHYGSAVSVEVIGGVSRAPRQDADAAGEAGGV